MQHRTRAVLGATAAVALAASALAAPAAASNRPGDATIYDIASSSADFTYLTAALEATGLDEALDGGGQFTVFAPTDAAFEKAADELAAAGVGDGTVPTLLAFLVQNDLADDVLLYHVTDGRRTAKSVVNRNSDKSIETLLGASLTSTPSATLVDASAATSDAKITATDISASNGVVHVIDNVLVPLP
ncbi:MAG TPA: fasciclin domain-containing protein [Jiangellales bacterium]|nr:fasciclin domain-containing protein [Jiangellales bacterium]